MFEVIYKQGNVTKTNIDVCFECLFDLIHEHKAGNLVILSIEDKSHHSYNIENLINNLK